MIVNKWLLIVGLILTMIVTVVAPALAEEEDISAGVTVNEVISFTVTDTLPEGISFGSVDRGTEDAEEVSQDASTPAVTVSVGSGTSVDCSVWLKASGDFSDSDGHTIGISNATWNTEYNPGGSASLTTDYVQFSNSLAGSPLSQGVWHWLDIPSDQYSGDYQTVFYYQAIPME